MKSIEKNGITLYSFESPAFQSVTTFVTTRERNSSDCSVQGNFNLGLYCGDDTTLVENNLLRLCQALEIERNMLFYPRQIHGIKIVTIDTTFMSQTTQEQKDILDGADAIITNIKEIAIAITTADCTPIIIYDTTHHAAAVIHAGWRGTAQEIVRHTLYAMSQQYGTQPSDIQAAIGPCIGQAAYEVGNDVVTAMQAAGYEINNISTTNAITGKTHIDLAIANTDLLLRYGVPLDHIEVCGICTYQNSDTFYSVRALGPNTGRFLTGIIL